MTRDEEVALVAQMATYLSPNEQTLRPTEAAESALQLLEAAEQAVDAKRGTEREPEREILVGDETDWERLAAAAKRLVDWWYAPRGAPLSSGAVVVEEIRDALAALQPEVRR